MPLRYSGTRAELAALFRSIVADVSAGGTDARAARAILTRGAVALLSQIQTAFVVKARGGTGSDGIKWKPLAPSTIARRRTSRKELRELGLNGGHGTGLLSDAHRKVFRKAYQTTLANLNARGKGATAHRYATAAGWNAVKRAGGKTRREVLAGREVEILRDTSQLFRSLTPGYEDAPAHPPGQVLEVEPGKITVGTVEKPWHHEGVPPHLPARPLWPTDGRLPDSWWNAVRGALLRGLAQAMADAVERGKT